LLQESLAALQIRAAGIYVDCTLGGGGHAEKILQQLSSGGLLIGFDQDAEAIARVSRRLAPFRSRAKIVQGNFRHVAALLKGAGADRVDGILMDLGLSRYQLEADTGGFSFQSEALLDMRMNRDASIPTAGDLINGADPKTLRKILVEYGEEKRWRSIVRAVVKAREQAPIRTARQLADLVVRALPGARRYRNHPATRTFQALRIAVNDELNALREGLQGAFHRLNPGGRLCVISFHSLEDRIVKQYFQTLEKGCVCPPALPVCGCGKTPSLRRVHRRPIVPSPAEVKRNPAARSARLRTGEKLSE
jgi:16S rRNA (cytosine1402-N4)-methyltransferase